MGLWEQEAGLWARVFISRLRLRLTYRRRGGGWSAHTTLKLSRAAERKARAAVWWRRIVSGKSLRSVHRVTF